MKRAVNETPENHLIKIQIRSLFSSGKTPQEIQKDTGATLYMINRVMQNDFPHLSFSKSKIKENKTGFFDWECVGREMLGTGIIN